MEIAHKQEETNPHYTEILERLKIGRIRTKADMERIFDTTSLSGETAEIHVSENTLIFLDTPIFNSAYVLDEYDKFMKIWPHYDLLSKALKNPPGMDEQLFEKAKRTIHEKLLKTVPNVKVYYCDDEDLHRELFAPFIESRRVPIDTPPSILMISPEAKAIFIDMEMMFPLDVSKMVMAHVMLNDALEINAQMVEADKTRREEIANNPDIN
jgi:hypothetical protein